MSTHQMFGYPGLDAGLIASRFGGDIAFSDRQNRPKLAKPCLRHFKECAKLCGLRGLEKLRGSWVVGRGSWVNLRGSWVLFRYNFA